MATSDEERRREYPGDRFSQRVLEQDLDELAEKLNREDLGEGHLEQGHNQIELYRRGGTTVSLFVLEDGAELPEHSVDDGSVMIHVLQGAVDIDVDDNDASLASGKNDVVTLDAGVGHTIRAEEASRLLVTIMRD